jgi:biotin carboxyl carrier protein
VAERDRRRAAAEKEQAERNRQRAEADGPKQRENDMAIEQVKIPSAGTEAEVVLTRWRVPNGAFVRAGEPILELETDKALQTVTAPVSGTITHRVLSGAKVAVGDVAAEIDTNAKAPAARRAPPPRPGAAPAPVDDDFGAGIRNEISKQARSAPPLPVVPSAPLAKTVTLLAWGSTQVGKTSLFAAGLWLAWERFATIDRVASRASVESTLMPNARFLLNNTLMPATSDDVFRIELSFKSGRKLVLTDVRGGLTNAAEAPLARETLDGASAVLFVAEWGNPELPRQIQAVREPLQNLLDTGRPAVLAFTKCEAHLAADDPAWRLNGPAPEKGWWRGRTTLGRADEELLDRLNAVWPTSVYGYDDNKRPACLLDEFGELIPFNIQPKNVTEMFLWYFNRLSL